MQITNRHFVTGNPMLPPFPAHLGMAMFGMGCFWGAERRFWQLPGVWTTAVGYSAGSMPDPDYRQVCSGRTGHSEVVRVVYDPAQISYRQLLTVFWESHDPTQGMRQGNDVGTQYRSGIYWHDPEQHDLALESRQAFAKRLAAAGFGPVTTEIEAAGEFWYAEDYHQQYLEKNPGGYCGLGGTGIKCTD
jgi:peptide-methionine (S)-S-oxide reductase